MNGVLLLTGGCGFVGSSLCILFKSTYPNLKIIAFDNLKRRGSELNIARLISAGVVFIHGDIRNKEDFDQIGPIDFLIDAAAEPSVMAGINESVDYVINTNLIGTINCLDFAIKHKALFLFLSTSRVYPFKTLDSLTFSESDTRFNLLPNQQFVGSSDLGVGVDFPVTGSRSFYGATKLASELLIAEYVEFLGLKAIVNRCGVLTGPWQMGKVDQGVVVLWMARHYWKKSLTYNGYGGQGKQVRDLLHVKDLFHLIDYQMKHPDLLIGKTLNVGGGLESSISLKELTLLCEQITGNKISIASMPENRKADVRIYVTDNSEVTNLTGWKPTYTINNMLKEIYSWIQSNEDELIKILN